MELTARTEAGLVRKAILTLPALGDSQDSLEIDAARQAVLFRHTGAGTTCQLSLSQPDAQGNEQFFASPEVPVSNLDTLAFSPQDWAGLATAPVTLTRTDSQGNQTQQTFSSFQTTVSWFEGECQLQVHGHAGMWCRIEWSSDLAAWYPLTTLANVTGLAQYFDPESRNLPQRFYRITEMPPPVAQEKLIWGTWTWDIDANSDQVSADSDLFWEMATATERYLVPMNGAAIALLYGASFDALTPDVLRAASYSTEAVSASDNNPVLDVGTVLAVRTTAGAYAKLQVIGFEPAGLKYNIRFAYVLFR
jgi:hypothetical protein